MNYSINVALNGRHYFATSDHSLLSNEAAFDLYNHFKQLFPASEGYSLTLQRNEKVGYVLAKSEFEDE